MIVVFSFLSFLGKSEAAEEFRFGVMLPLSGAGSTYGIPQLNAIKMAVEEINGKGGITVAGKKYALSPIVYDDKGFPSEGVTIFEKLVNFDKVKVILGPVNSGNVMAIAPKVGDQTILMTTGTIVSAYTELGNPYIFRPHTSVKNIINALLDFMTKDLDIRSLGMVASKNPVTIEQINAIEAKFKKEGRAFWVEYCDLQATNLYPQITSLATKKPDAMYPMGYPDQTALTYKQMHELGLAPKYRISTSAGSTEEFLRVTSADILEGCYEAGAATLDTVIQSGSVKAIEFYKRFKEKFGVAPSSPAGTNSYDVVYILAKAVENSGTVTDLVKMRTALQNIGKVEQTILDYPVVKGKIFNEKNEIYVGGALRQFRNGEFKFIKFI
jgi:branched-chain amino acid transport system substrate-binding protein